VLARTRHAVEDILALLAGGSSIDDVRDSYGLAAEELHACFDYARGLIPNRMMQRAEPGEARIHVSARQLRKAFERHTTAGFRKLDKANLLPSRLLLLVYAVECGLKELLLKRRGVHSTSKLDRDDLTHDLDELLKLLGQRPRFYGVALLQPAENAPPQRIHEALRYGRPLSDKAHDKIITAIREVIAFIRENRE
jgi:hypothetical protein